MILLLVSVILSLLGEGSLCGMILTCRVTDGGVCTYAHWRHTVSIPDADY